MSTHTHTKESHGTVASYITGFVLSLILTGMAYTLVAGKLLSDSALIWAIIVLALLQLGVQLFFFLHLNAAGQRSYQLILASIAVVIAILVGGTIWIMNNLHYNMGGQDEVNQFLIKDEGLQP